MKNSLLTIASSIVILSACENTAETQSKNTIKEFTNYVDSIKKVSPEYTNAYW